MEFGYNFSFMINITINGDFFVIGHSKTIIIHIVTAIRINLPTYFCHTILEFMYECWKMCGKSFSPFNSYFRYSVQCIQAISS